jgi:hypothetical protein
MKIALIAASYRVARKAGENALKKDMLLLLIFVVTNRDCENESV